MEEQYITVLEDSVETVLIDADLFAKYKSPEKAFKLLLDAIERNPQSIALREKMREIANVHGNTDKAAKQCLALASLYIRSSNLDLADDRLREANYLDPRISIVSGLEAIRIARARIQSGNDLGKPVEKTRKAVLSGDIAHISIFDIVEVIENAFLTGLLILKPEKQVISILFNNGKIVDAEAGGLEPVAAFRRITETNEGEFEFVISEEKFPEVVVVKSNKDFLLSSAASLEAVKAEKQGLRDLSKEEIVD